MATDATKQKVVDAEAVIQPKSAQDEAKVMNYWQLGCWKAVLCKARVRATNATSSDAVLAAAAAVDVLGREGASRATAI